MPLCLLHKKSDNTNKGTAGFTLIEVLVAITIFAIGLLAIAGMQVTGIRGNATSHAVMAKVAMADGVLEEFLAMEPNSIAINTNGALNAWRQENIDGAGNLVANVVIDVNPTIGGTTYTGLSQIEVTVVGSQGANVTKNVMKRRN